ncbi:low molecular weight protein-tyrosine-phosphatase [Pararobbsia alpina]|uniref:protein-tyrosine-phosphatase n=1 Tax=Pararobbsia alpina TaxID=621374 RepID=A0A6S7B720_9BURK|nr:low molecular weight protein-tyrosine-phosphatase [Pararobbsia alpina]CAB3781790.1 Low molecular weight protein-tyrosine-phosphatase Ptp [Pararobbsia alpina]
MDTLLVLCTGNLCRSPMAAAVLQRALPALHVMSAGFKVHPFESADALAVRLMRERGYDLGTHRTQPLSSWMVRAANLILVMETSQRCIVETLYPGSRGKVFRLADTQGLDVPDPYGRGEAAFRHALQLIEAGAVSWIDRLTRLTSKSLSKDVD